MSKIKYNPLDVKVSWFEHYSQAANPDNRATLEYILTSEISKKMYLGLNEEVRATKDKEARDAKKEKLPCFTVSGTFKHRSIEGLLQHSGLMAFDIDPKGNPILSAKNAPSLRDKIALFPQVCYVALSASGQGVWGIVAIEKPEYHAEHFAALKEDFASWGIVIDNGCGNIDRLRFWSYDPEATIKSESVIYTKLRFPKVYKPAPWASVGHPEDLATQAAAYLINSRKAVAFCYNDYFKVVTACKAAFGDNGQSVAWEILENSPCFAASNFRKDFARKWRDAGSRITGGTLVHMAKAEGFTYQSETPAPPAPTPPPMLPKDYRRERYTSSITHETFDVLLNEHGYPAAWDADPVQHESIARNVHANPLITELSCRLSMRFDGVLPLDEAEAAEWQAKRDRAQAIKRRAIDKEQQQKQAPHRASDRREERHQHSRANLHSSNTGTTTHTTTTQAKQASKAS